LKQLIKIAVFFAMLFAVACSTQKNTFITRNYHGLVSHYNIYFNGKESYKKGIARINSGYKDDYNQLLNVFTYTDKELNSTAASEMDVAIKKASKVINSHSIKAKPKYKNNKLTPSEKAFMARNEYNNWVDDSYLLITKANFHKNDFPEASKTISFILREFPKEQVRYEALIWQSRIHLQSNEFIEAEKILNNLASDKKFPKKYNAELNATFADYYIKKQQYKQAAEKLEEALKTVRGKQRRTRYTYILAQLYQRLHNYNSKTIELYEKVVKMNPPYEMTFNARINLASLIDADSKDTKNIKAQLYKMLKDQKNKDFRDQIYFALANMELREKNEEKAIELFKLAAASTTNNDQQKATTYLTLADLYYGKKQYIPAQAYYDSCTQTLRQDHPDAARVQSRAANLNRLVESLNTIELEDSLLRLSSMSENERMRVVERIIRSVRDKEAEEQQKALLASQNLNNFNSRNLTASTSQGSWYFYNPVSVQQGMAEFQARWGKRKLEDNWRRRNKGVSAAAMDNMETAANENQGQEKKAMDNKTPEFYLQNIPVTDSARVASHNKIKESFVNAAEVYRDDLNEIDEAIKLYEELVRRYPTSDYTPSAYYNLFSAYTKAGNNSMAEKYKQLILSQYPNSIYAKVLSDPEFAKRASEEESKVNSLYEETYKLYQSGNYQQVISNADQALNQYKKSELAPKFAFLRALSMSKTVDVTTFRRELEKVISTYPNNEVAVSAKDIIAKIDNTNPEVAKTEEIKKAEATYSQDDKAPYVLAWIVTSNEDINQLVFDIINFNLDNFNKEKFEIQNADFTAGWKIITINQFNTRADAIKYFNVFCPSPVINKNLRVKKTYCFVINADNLKILQKDQNADTYQRFFEEFYLNK
jgi:tetratricopeptide (TPR) repeat protein